jgi:hypothetical protein
MKVRNSSGFVQMLILLQKLGILEGFHISVSQEVTPITIIGNLGVMDWVDPWVDIEVYK